jgi:hypothetical protein
MTEARGIGGDPWKISASSPWTFSLCGWLAVGDIISHHLPLSFPPIQNKRDNLFNVF